MWIHSFSQRSFSYVAPSVWNSLPCQAGHQIHSHLSNRLWNLTFSSYPVDSACMHAGACVYMCMCVVCVCVCVLGCRSLFLPLSFVASSWGYAPCSSSEKLIAHKRVHYYYYYNYIGNLMSETVDIIFIMKYSDYLDLIFTQHDSVSDAL